MKEPKGSIVIVARNNLALTKNTVRSALTQTYPCNVLVIDNGSTDGTVEWLRSKGGIIYISRAALKSLASCWNMGIRMMMGNMGHVLVINNDVEIRPDTYKVLLEHSTGFITGVSVRNRADTIVDLPPMLHASPHPDFSCFMISQDVFKKVGRFDESYFPAYFEDNDYHIRMHRLGVEAVSIPLPFYHVASGTLKAATESDKIVISRGYDENKRRFQERYGCLPGTPEYEELFK